jgi:hypothetical protein
VINACAVRELKAGDARSYIDVERRVILSDTLPDALDGNLFGVTEGRVVASVLKARPGCSFGSATYSIRCW